MRLAACDVLRFQTRAAVLVCALRSEPMKRRVDLGTERSSEGALRGGQRCPKEWARDNARRHRYANQETQELPVERSRLGTLLGKIDLPLDAG